MAKKSSNPEGDTSGQIEPQKDDSLDYPSGEGEKQKHILAEHASYFSGPLPPPELLERYNEIIPDGAERILRMAEEQSSHRRKMERQFLEIDRRNSLLGLLFAFVLGLSTVISGVICIVKGQEVSGTIIGGAGLVGLVSVFIYGTRQRAKEGKDK